MSRFLVEVVRMHVSYHDGDASRSVHGLGATEELHAWQNLVRVVVANASRHHVHGTTRQERVHDRLALFFLEAHDTWGQKVDTRHHLTRELDRVDMGLDVSVFRQIDHVHWRKVDEVLWDDRRLPHFVEDARRLGTPSRAFHLLELDDDAVPVVLLVASSSKQLDTLVRHDLFLLFCEHLRHHEEVIHAHCVVDALGRIHKRRVLPAIRRHSRRERSHMRRP